jgi:flagellar biosynthesis/type III secretory pathway M-ring protein FliF/YscJ
MLRVLVSVLVAAVVAGFITVLVMRARRQKADATPELHKHPERLDQMLDPTDDA